MWTACPEQFVPSHSQCPQLLPTAATVIVTASIATAGTAAAVVHNRSRSPLVRPAASHSTAAVSCHHSQLLCAVPAGTAVAVVHIRSRSPSEAAHRWCTLPHPTPQPLSAATIHSCCAPSLPAPPLPLSTIEAAHRRCALLHPLHSRRPLPPSTVAVRCCCCHRRCRCPTAIVHCHHSQCNICRSWYFIKNRQGSFVILFPPLR